MNAKIYILLIAFCCYGTRVFLQSRLTDSFGVDLADTEKYIVDFLSTSKHYDVSFRSFGLKQNTHFSDQQFTDSVNDFFRLESDSHASDKVVFNI